ncbi:MAG: M55 family metallopeptidase, partial [Candidatus Latescibacteria bacterium]|nr:M55 family metallopeptidase [Candidatus Latescibacterota bacterium]
MIKTGANMKVLITTDLEGVSGIIEWDRHETGTPLDQWQRTLMTGEVNAAIAGAYDAGATRVKVAEGHEAIDIIHLDERATLVPAHWPALPIYAGWDEGFDAMIQIGKHSMANTPDGILAHTFNRDVDYMEINGIRMGEIGVGAAEAGDFGIPMVMISGDTAACREAQELLGSIEIAPVKTGTDCHHADCLHPNAAGRLIHNKVVAALKRVEDFKPFVIPGPIRLVQRTRTPLDRDAVEKLKSKDYAE